MELYTRRQNYYRQLNIITVGGLGMSAVKWFLFALLVLILLLFTSNNNLSLATYPPEVRTVGIFELRFYSGSKDDKNYVQYTDSYSDRPFTTEMINESVKYVGYWEQLVNTSKVTGDYKIVVNFTYDSSVKTALGGGSNIVNIINNGAKPNATQTDAMISIGGRFDRETIIHEFGHVLGFSVNEMAPYLVDIYGEKYTDTNTVAITGAGTINDGIFNLYEDAGDANFKYPVFLGRRDGAIEELIGSVHNWDGSLDTSKLDILAQAAIQGTSTNPQTGEFAVDLSHTGNMHSLMSYGAFINMPFMPEIELAMLEELGYSINRRKAFGHSYYKRSDDKYDGLVIGLDGYNSDFIFGVGAHVFMDGLNLLQTADISSGGEEGAGIRVDGSNNTISVDKFTNVEASGKNGVGLMVAWGSNNVLINRGIIAATGEGGIAVELNVKGGDAHSYYTNTGNGEARDDAEHYRATQDLKDALVNRFDISGEIIGKEYAIFINSTAHVKEINIMNGAKIYGNIVSNYNGITNLTFGKLAADDNGEATNSADLS
ncbi:MAG: hypothetical protein LBC74_14670, partial [Planctomycetaceae bacterium]|nr:hypothetical protein [Planctomycetaceae bacterium]